MIASLFYLKSLGCGGCITTLVTLAIASLLLIAALKITAPQVLPDLCQLHTVEVICATP